MERIIASSPVNQRGASKLGVFVVFSILVVGLTAVLKVAPIYVDHNFITGVIKSMQETGDANNMSQSAIRDEVSGTLRINNIRGFDLSNIKSSRNNNNTRITVIYERKVHLFFNIDLLISFNEVFE